MTALSNRRIAPSYATYDSLTGELIDQLADVVTMPPDPHTRSVVIASLAAEIFERIRWLHGSEPDQEELASLYRVLAEVYAHRNRMAARSVVGGRR